MGVLKTAKPLVRNQLLAAVNNASVLLEYDTYQIRLLDLGLHRPTLMMSFSR